ncbi:hypothetical protein [Lentzea cavernae]|uniref:Uncharacterized protein n=1 Tax=Lentzea cavernae TaxID=2020703 RepID=A0ABQ3MGK6_9PSEU|nr:hypothetical protein [Lentzea cavernae]GHH44031.1 hypothetical protein GCM10017774_42800 [Lentzea cavernae]
MTLRSLADVLRADQLSLIQPDFDGNEGSLSDLELLSDALAQAIAAHESGHIVGPGVDELALRRAERQARRADARRMLAVHVVGGAA